VDQVSGVSGQASDAPVRGSELTPETRHLTPYIAARRGSARKAAEGRAGFSASEAERYERIKALLAERGQLTSGEVQFDLAVDANVARALLRRLLDEGLARVEGEKRGTWYVVVTP
jgi:predicted HTH transcriptional regulator